MSLRFRILGGISVIALVLVLVTLAVTRLTQANMVDQVDRQLVAAIGTVRSAGPPMFNPSNSAGASESQTNDYPIPPGGLGDPNVGRFSSLYVGRVVDDEVETIFSPTIFGDSAAIPTVTASQALASAASGKAFSVDSNGSERFRVLAYRDLRSGVIVVLGSGLGAVDSSINRLMVVQALGVVVILGALATLAWWVIRLGVRPIRAMTEVATSIAEGDLSQRVPQAAAGTEAGDLGRALNLMLGQIDSSFQERERIEARLRRFVADASHELRTPIATIRGYAELYRAGGLERTGSLADAMARTEVESIRMGTLVEELLELARLDESRPLEVDRVDLRALILDAAADLTALAPDRTVKVDALAPVFVRGDEGRLRQVIANLVANVLAHTDDSAAIGLAVHSDGGNAQMVVSDSGRGMDDETATKVFDRFYRADPARSRNRGGSGLGLSIVEAIVTAHGGEVQLDSTVGKGTSVTVTLASES